MVLDTKCTVSHEIIKTCLQGLYKLQTPLQEWLNTSGKKQGKLRKIIAGFRHYSHKLGGSDYKSICLQCKRPRFDPWVWKITWRRKWQPTPVLLPGKSHGPRSLVGYSPWGLKESDMTDRLHFTSLTSYWLLFFFLALVPTFLSMEIHSTWDIAIKMLSHACFTPVNSICSQYMYYIWWIYTVHIGERNDNPLQYSCLENPMDRRAWQATVHGIPKSQTQLNTHAHTLFI